MNRRGEVILIALVIAFAVGVLGTIVARTRHEGTNLYPERAYPYQGKLMIGTNQIVGPKW